MILTFDNFLISTELFDGIQIAVENVPTATLARYNIRISIDKVPTATLLRLERILLLFQDVCQNSDDFCMTLGRTGFIQCLDDLVYTFSIHEICSGLPQVCI